MSRIVIVDTNVLVAGLLTGRSDSPVARILDQMIDGTLPFLMSPDLLAEYRAVLLRPAIARRHGLSVEEVEQILVELAANAIWCEPEKAPGAAPDPGDDHLWSLLANSRDALLITGDKLLIDQPPEPASVVSPAAWLALTTGD